ncbi:MAG TPA: hypothetical protein VK741_14840 [Acetobacteraceae bacterium]|nr:hypothetical protein [Acetobacteraceae bacterium]
MSVGTSCQPSCASLRARSKIFPRTAWHAASTAGATLGTVDEPPDTGAGGNVLSPSSNRTRCTGTPSVSAATCDITV